MIKVIVYLGKNGYKSARLVADLGYRKLVLSWDINVCAELLKISVYELLGYEPNTEIEVK